MNTTVIICSANRARVLHDTVQSIFLEQSRSPAEIILSIFDDQHIASETKEFPTVRVAVGSKKGLTSQRNLAASLIQTPYTLFLDDDVEIAPNYIESMERLFDQSPDVLASTGYVVADGAQGDTGLDRIYAKRLTREYTPRPSNFDHDEAYGCNIFVRTSIFSSVRFDENLPLYGWLEDYDFASNCLRYGKIALNAETCIAHLATPTGRTSGTRFGYSQIVNPLYLWNKNKKPSLYDVIFHHWALAAARNLRRTVFRMPTDRDDRTGRFRGNLLAFRDLLKGKLDPTSILHL